jgi:hypothetical protein
MGYTHSLPDTVSFAGKGLSGYTFPLNQKDIEVEKGHDFFMVSKKIKRTYYIISGSGCFTIDKAKHDVQAGMVVEVPAGVEYCYSGKMKMIGFSRPRWFPGNDKATRWNPDVFDGDSSIIENNNSRLKRLLKGRIFGKSPFTAFFRSEGKRTRE